MSKLRFNRETLRKACVKLDAANVCAILVDAVAPDEDHAEGCLEAIVRSDCMVARRPAPKSLAARDALAARIRAYLAGFPDCLKKFKDHMGAARLVEASFHDILATIDSFDISRQPPAVRAWACIQCATSELNTATRLYEQQQQTHPRISVLKHPMIDAGNGRMVSLDAVAWNLTRGLAQNLKMLGYSAELFDATTEELVLPAPVAIDEETANQAGLLFVMELAWSDLVTGWDRVRFLDGSVISGRKALPFDNQPEPVEVDMLEFSDPTRGELFDAIAVSRLTQNLLQHHMDLAVFAEGKQHLRSLDAGPVALPEPGNFISDSELVAFHFMEEVLFLPMRESSDHAGGLSLRHWLRGYASIAELCRENGNPALEAKLVARADVVARLVWSGFRAGEADLFIGHVTFGREARDLMDEPLVRIADGRFMLFAPAYRGPALSTIIMSRLGRFKRDFSAKGKRFEAAVRKQFEEVGVPARSFGYKIDGVPYNCDVAALWGRTLFAFECKTHGLPFGHLPSLSDFQREFFHAARQASRTKDFLEKNPQEARDHFGADAKWDRVVACVLYAAPWGVGRILKGDHDLYSYDASALGKFLGDGFIALQAPRRHKNLTVVRRHRHTLWKGDKPDDEAFLHQLRDPIQLRIEAAARKVEAMFRETAPRKGLVLPAWKLVATTPEEMLRAMSLPDEKTAEIAQSMVDFHAAADTFDRRQARKSPKRKRR